MSILLLSCTYYARQKSSSLSGFTLCQIDIAVHVKNIILNDRHFTQHSHAQTITTVCMTYCHYLCKKILTNDIYCKLLNKSGPDLWPHQLVISSSLALMMMMKYEDITKKKKDYCIHEDRTSVMSKCPWPFSIKMYSVQESQKKVCTKFEEFLSRWDITKETDEWISPGLCGKWEIWKKRKRVTFSIPQVTLFSLLHSTLPSQTVFRPSHSEYLYKSCTFSLWVCCGVVSLGEQRTGSCNQHWRLSPLSFDIVSLCASVWDCSLPIFQCRILTKATL